MLTDKQCKNALCEPDKKRSRFTDSAGLYLEVSPAGSKRWFCKLYAAGKEGRMALGSYPKVGLADARRARDRVKLQKSLGVDPIQARRVEKLKASNRGGDTFKEVSMEWYERQAPQWSPGHADRAKRQLERDLFPWLGGRVVRDIEAVELLATLRKIEARGAVETADRVLMLARQIWRYAVVTARADRDITEGLKDALTPYRGTHFGAITEPQKLGELLNSLDAYRGGAIVRAALQLSPILFQRPGELRGAEWSELDLEGALWTIPASRMKRTKDGKENGEPHFVPLPRQAVEIFKDLKAQTGRSRLVFPGEANL